jgi:hypothetical protein
MLDHKKNNLTIQSLMIELHITYKQNCVECLAENNSSEYNEPANLNNYSHISHEQSLTHELLLAKSGQWLNSLT